MTRDDILALDTGDSIIGLNNRWDDEYTVTRVGKLHYTVLGRAWRPVTINVDHGEVNGSVLEGDPSIRGCRRCF